MDTYLVGTCICHGPTALAANLASFENFRTQVGVFLSFVACRHLSVHLWPFAFHKVATNQDPRYLYRILGHHICQTHFQGVHHLQIFFDLFLSQFHIRHMEELEVCGSKACWGGDAGVIPALLRAKDSLPEWLGTSDPPCLASKVSGTSFRTSL